MILVLTCKVFRKPRLLVTIGSIDRLFKIYYLCLKSALGVFSTVVLIDVLRYLLDLESIEYDGNPEAMELVLNVVVRSL